MKPRQSLLLVLGALALQSCSSMQDWKPPADARHPWPSRTALSMYSNSLEEGWDPHQEQRGIGVDIIVQERGKRYGFEAIGLLGGDGILNAGDDRDFVNRFVGVGGHMSFDEDPPIVPFVGAGFAFVSVEADSPNPALDETDASSVGFYGRVGLDWVINDTVFIGVAYQLLGGTDVELDGFDQDDVNGEWVLFRVGVGF